MEVSSPQEDGERAVLFRSKGGAVQKWRRVAVLIFICLFMAWPLFIILFPLMGDGMFYHMEQPLPISEVRYNIDAGDNGTAWVVVRVQRHAWRSMVGYSTKQIICDTMESYPPRSIDLASSDYLARFEVISGALNPGGGMATCYLSGIIMYEPLGKIAGLKLSYGWKSDTFEVDRSRVGGNIERGDG